MKKNTKRKMNKKKKKMIIIVAVIVAFLVLLTVILKLIQNNKKIESIYDANSLKAVIEFCDCKYIAEKDSELDDYNMDIYMEFKYSPYQDGKSQQPFYDVTIDAITNYLSYRKIRLIDESKGLVIRVDTNNTSKITNKYFNDIEESEYFNRLLSDANLENKSSLEETNFSINTELQALVNNEWNTSNINFGQRTSTFRNYDIYFDNGYRVRNIAGKLFNIVFTNKFEKPVIGNIKVGDSFETIKSQLGDNYIEKNGILEYMSKDLYVCFTTNEISVYPKITYNYTMFERLLEQYNEDKDFNSFMNNLTSMWPDYSYYAYDTDYCKISYPLKGVKIDNSTNALNGIQIFQEYTGSLATEHKNYYQVYYKTNDSLILDQELNRLMDKSEIPSDSDTHISSKYAEKSKLNEDGKKYNIAFFSIDGSNADSELDKNIYADQTYWYDDDNYIYSINHRGIYIYNVTTRKTMVLVEGTDEFNITNFDYTNKILTYDGKDIKIEA